MSNKRGKLFVVSGPSGCGKSTVCRKVSERTGAEISVSATTRPQRGDEQSGVDYLFLSRDEFATRAEDDWFYEHAEVYGEMYGTPRQPIEEGLAVGKNFLLDIDVQGASSVKNVCGDAVRIFIAPPDMDELRRRLEGRATESNGDMKLRMSQAASEMACRDQYDYVVLNRDLEQTVVEVVGIVESERKNGRIL